VVVLLDMVAVDRTVVGQADLDVAGHTHLGWRLGTPCHNTQHGLVDCLHHTGQIVLLVDHAEIRRLAVDHSYPVWPEGRSSVALRSLVADSPVAVRMAVVVGHSHHIADLARMVAGGHPAGDIGCMNRKDPTWRECFKANLGDTSQCTSMRC